jgi:DHA1 family solute carrier family 18 vesicular amine transporter 1/2
MSEVFKSKGVRTPWHLRVLYISTFILRTAFGALLLLISAYVAGDQGLLNVAIIAVPYPLAEMATANYFGILSDRIGRRSIIVFGTTLAAIVVAMYALSDDRWYLATMHGIHGIGAAATVAPAIAMIADHADSRDRGRQMGWFDYSTFIGYIIGAVVGGFMVDLVDPRVGFLIIAGMLAISATMLYTLVKKESSKTKAEHYASLADLKRVFKVREIRLMFPIWLIIATLLGLAITYLPIILLNEGTSGATIGIMFAAAGIALGLLQPFWGKVSDIVGRIPVMAYGVFSIAGIAVMLVFFPNAAFSQDDAGFHFKLMGMIPLGILGLGAGAFVPSALALMADSSDAESYGATMGLYSFALGFGAFVAESLGLAIIVITGSDSAPGWILYFAAVLVALAVVMMIVFFLSAMLTRRLNKGRADRS